MPIGSWSQYMSSTCAGPAGFPVGTTAAPSLRAGDLEGGVVVQGQQGAVGEAILPQHRNRAGARSSADPPPPSMRTSAPVTSNCSPSPTNCGGLNEPDRSRTIVIGRPAKPRNFADWTEGQGVCSEDVGGFDPLTDAP